MGYLPEALVNFLGLMGHSMPEGEEVFDVQAFIEAFSLERVTLGAPVFDQEKLAWLNGQWLRGLSDEAFADRVMAWGLNRDALMPLVPLIKPRTERLCDLAPMVGYLLGARRSLAAEDFEGLALEGEALLEVLQFTLWRLEALSDWTRPQLVATVEALAAELGLKIRVLLAPLFVALSGQAVSLPLYDSLVFLGPDLARARLRDGLEALGGVSKKAAKRLEKRYGELGQGSAEEESAAES
jgi:glutamyl-tRNA synthetase